MKIQPNKKVKKPPEELLTLKQTEYIQFILEQSCTGKICLSRSYLFEQLKEPLKLQIEQYQFEQAITAAIKSGKITGFKTRTGRSGGICRVEAFVNKKNICSIIFAGNVYNVSSENQMYGFITSVLNAKPATANRGNIHINNIGYKIPSINTKQIIENFLINVCNAEKIETSELETVAQ
jgi:hypothetical protein